MKPQEKLKTLRDYYRPIAEKILKPDLKGLRESTQSYLIVMVTNELISAHLRGLSDGLKDAAKEIQFS